VIHQPDVGVTYDTKTQEIGYYGMLSTLFWLNMSLALGGLLQTGLRYLGASLRLFVCSLFAAILLTNTVPRILKTPWPAGTRSLALVSDVSLGVFLAMSLMRLQLWTIVDVAGPIIALLAVQALLAVIFALFVIFRFMGRDYEAAVICSGFADISLGAAPTAMANMTAVAKKYGQAHRAFIIVPLVSGFHRQCHRHFPIPCLVRLDRFLRNVSRKWPEQPPESLMRLIRVAFPDLAVARQIDSNRGARTETL
jgi:ESS family glutamate:Na+ symporter